MSVSRGILLFGARGQLGRELARALSLLGPVAEADMAECDLTDLAALRTYIRALSPRLIVNTAAYTAVDRAESEPELAARLNAECPAAIAAEAAQLGVPLVHYSTDYVYDGCAATPYVEEHEFAPLSVYGRTKLEGDLAIAASGCRHLILRTTWVYGHFGQNFVKTILRLARSRAELRIVVDQQGAPTWSRLLATATALAVHRLEDEGPAAWDQASGAYHLSAAGRTDWLSFAEEIVAQARLAGLLGEDCARLLPTTASEYGAAAARPANSVLSNAKFQARFGVTLPDWRQSFRQMFEEHPARLLD
jgi:dTDP-4-dehydrorhamnose reductase